MDYLQEACEIDKELEELLSACYRRFNKVIDSKLFAVLSLGRNDKCSCGSEKKAKKCCLNKAERSKSRVAEFLSILQTPGNSPITILTQ